MWKSAKQDTEVGADDSSLEPDSSKEGQQEKGKGGSFLSKKLVVLLVAGLVLAGGGIGAAKFLGGAGTSASKKKKVVAPLTHAFDEILVNLSGHSLTRMLSCSIHVEVDSAEALTEIKLREVIFHDALIDLLQSKTVKDMEYPGPIAIKRQVRDRFNRMLTNGTVVGVYLKEFMVVN